jgi:hypothetical protein
MPAQKRVSYKTKFSWFDPHYSPIKTNFTVEDSLSVAGTFRCLTVAKLIMTGGTLMACGPARVKVVVA